MTVSGIWMWQRLSMFHPLSGLFSASFRDSGAGCKIRSTLACLPEPPVWTRKYRFRDLSSTCGTRTNIPSCTHHSQACSREWCSWYTSHYCEENTLRLCSHLLEPAEEAGVDLFIVFISNHLRQVPLWCQRLADRHDEPVLWDYHGELPFFWVSGCARVVMRQRRTSNEDKYTTGFFCPVSGFDIERIRTTCIIWLYRM